MKGILGVFSGSNIQNTATNQTIRSKKIKTFSFFDEQNNVDDNDIRLIDNFTQNPIKLMGRIENTHRKGGSLAGLLMLPAKTVEKETKKFCLLIFVMKNGIF